MFLIRVHKPLIILRYLIVPLELLPSGVFVEMTRFTVLPLPAEPPTQRVVLTALQMLLQILAAVLERYALDLCPRTSNVTQWGQERREEESYVVLSASGRSFLLISPLLSPSCTVTLLLSVVCSSTPASLLSSGEVLFH